MDSLLEGVANIEEIKAKSVVSKMPYAIVNPNWETESKVKQYITDQIIAHPDLFKYHTADVIDHRPIKMAETSIVEVASSQSRQCCLIM